LNSGALLNRRRPLVSAAIKNFVQNNIVNVTVNLDAWLVFERSSSVVFTARRYARALCAMTMYLPVRTSV